MEFEGLFGFFGIVRESLKLVPKNGKLMALLAIILIVISWILSAALAFSVATLSEDMFAYMTSVVPDPTSFNPSDIDTAQQIYAYTKQFMVIIYAIELAFILVIFFISLFSTVATILISATSYKGSTFSVQELFSRTAKTWVKPLVTSIYVFILVLGYFLLAGLLAFPGFFYPNMCTILLEIFVGIVAFVVFLYLLVILDLSIVISVLEESCYGLEAIGKASNLVKGQRLNGYMLNLFFLLLGFVIVVPVFVFYKWQFYSSLMVYGLLLVPFSCLIKILQVMAYTVLYFHCKQENGEGVETDGIKEYALLLSAQPIDKFI